MNASVVASLLNDIGYPLMASHAATESNIEILRGYVSLIHIQASRSRNCAVLQRLWISHLIN